jgi:hypothetical protein
MWCVPELDAEYIERMEDVLDTYEKPLSTAEPVICLDEKPIQMLQNSNPMSRLTRKHRVRRKDYEYRRKGTANAFCVVEPKKGRHFVKITRRRKSEDFARMMQDIGRAYPRARVIHLVMDNLSTHSKTALIKTLGPKRGENLWNRFHVHFTPKHASWLDQAEIEISMFSRQCLGRDRISTRRTLAKRAAAWCARMNALKVTIDWTFTRAKAREKFKYDVSKSSEMGN